MTVKECIEQGWLPAPGEADDPVHHGIDFVLVTGDAYVDHPSFANAVIGRLLEARGYRVAIGLEIGRAIPPVRSATNRMVGLRRKSRFTSQSLHCSQETPLR